MEFTPLQKLLSQKVVPPKEVQDATNRSRHTIWRWEKGKTFPDPHEDVPDLLLLFEPWGLTYEGCYKPSSFTITTNNQKNQGSDT